jgi:hypothetical protein
LFARFGILFLVSDPFQCLVLSGLASFLPFRLPFQMAAISLCSSLRPGSRVHSLPIIHFRIVFQLSLVIRSLLPVWFLSLLVLAVSISHLLNSVHII